MLEFTPSTTLLYPLPIPGIVSIGIIFAFTNMCVQYLHCIHPPILFLCHLPPPNPPLCCRICSALLFSNFVEDKRKRIKEKKVTFLLV
jgi:hypothetical protein